MQWKFKLPRFWGAMDGTVQPIAMPVLQQETVYNGHKQCHALKYQFISLPNELIFCLVPYAGCHHDAYVVNDTDLTGWAQQHAKNKAGEQMYLLPQCLVMMVLVMQCYKQSQPLKVG